MDANHWFASIYWVLLACLVYQAVKGGLGRWRARTSDLSRDKRFNFLLVFKGIAKLKKFEPKDIDIGRQRRRIPARARYPVVRCR